jgi:GNAT superfamily N-acetyltransferase
MSVEIRPFLLGDIQKLQSLWSELFKSQREFSVLDMTTVSWNAHLLRCLNDKDVEFLVAECASKPVAFVSFRTSENKIVIVENLFVSPDFRSQGIATRLLNSVEEAIESFRPDQLHIQCAAANRAAVQLYAKLGYQQSMISHIKQYIPPKPTRNDPK